MEPIPDDRFLPLIFDNVSYGIFTIDGQGVITSFNRAAERLTGYSRDEAIGRPCHEVFRADHCLGTCVLKKSIETGDRIEDVRVHILTRRGRRLPIAISTTALVDEGGKVLGGVEMFRDLSTEEELRKKLTDSYGFDDLTSKSPAMRRVFELLPLVARSDSNALIEGASGTGKEVIARTIHLLSPRSEGPFVPVNCSAIPDTLLESELFGYVKGAFTDAKADKPGRFAVAAGGTLLLDEIGELSLPLQAKLLRVLQTRQYEPLGGTTTVKADVRVLASTNRDLAMEVRRRRFREDLYFRLNVIRIQLPVLAERKEDIPLLVERFIERFNALQGRRIRRCTETAMAALLAHDYPGNVRELENAIEHGFVLCTGDTIQLEDLPIGIARVTERKDPAAERMKPLAQAEAERIRLALERNGNHRQAAARELGISRNTLWRKMRGYGLLSPRRRA